MRRPTLLLALLILILGVGPARRSPAADAAPAQDTPAAAIAAEVTDANGDKREAKILSESIDIRTNAGLYKLRLDKVKRLTWFDSEEGPTDTVELLNGERLHGEIVGEVFTEGDKLDRTAARTLTLRRAADKTMTAVIVALITLTVMEIILGIDNIIFLAIVAARLPEERQPKARKIGLLAALGTRILLLLSITFLMGLTKPLFTLPALPFFEDIEARQVTARDLILLLGGLFLLVKSVHEIHAKLEEGGHDATKEEAMKPKSVSFAGVLVQIALIDILFSLDSVITAIGMVDQVWIMIAATTIAMLVMLAFADPIANFVNRHPTVKMLALAFLILIGAVLILEGFGGHVDKGYVYFAMGFAFAVEALNLRFRKKAKAQAAALPPAANS